MNRQLVIYVTDSTRKKLKTAALKQDTNVSALVNALIAEFLSNGKKRGKA